MAKGSAGESKEELYKLIARCSLPWWTGQADEHPSPSRRLGPRLLSLTFLSQLAQPVSSVRGEGNSRASGCCGPPILECSQYPAAASLENCPRCLIPHVKPPISVKANLAPLHRGGPAKSTGTSLGLAIPPCCICPALPSFSLCILLNFFPLKLPFPVPPNKSSKLNVCHRLLTQAGLRQEQTVGEGLGTGSFTGL
jgi:hypothetical protein